MCERCAPQRWGLPPHFGVYASADRGLLRGVFRPCFPSGSGANADRFPREPKGAQPGTTYERALRPTRASAASLSPAQPPRPGVLVPLCLPLFATFRLFFRACALFFFVKVAARGLSGFFSSSLPTIERQTRNFVHFQWANLPFSHRYNSTFAVVVSICFCIARRQPVVLETAHHRHIWQFCDYALHSIRYARLHFVHMASRYMSVALSRFEYAPLRFGHHLGGGTPPGFCPVTWRFCA